MGDSDAPHARTMPPVEVIDRPSGGPAGAPDAAAPASSAQQAGWQRPSWLRITCALGVAVASDLFSFLTSSLVVTWPAVLAVDGVTGLLIWLALGRPLLVLPVLVAEAVPGVGTLPWWTAVVVLVAIFGKIPGRDPSKALSAAITRAVPGSGAGDQAKP